MKKIIALFTGKIKVKVVTITLAALLISIIILTSVSYPVLFRFFTGDTYRKLSNIAESIDLLIPDTGAYYFDLYSLSQNNGVDFEIVNTENVLVYTTKGAGSALSPSHFATTGSTVPEFTEMTKSTRRLKGSYRNFEILRKNASNAEYFVYHADISTGDMVYLYYPVSDIENVVALSDRVYSVMSIAAVALIGVIFVIIVSRITSPIEQMNSVTGKMASLDFSRKCEDYGKDEVGELGRRINELSDKLNHTLADLKDKNAQLENDIQLRLALDNARKSFISNVSHELKTPIAIISGYAEGLYEGISDDPQTIREYCGIINNESQKMNELVLELLELSKLESGSQPFLPDYYDIGKSISNILAHLSLQIKTNGITVENHVPSSVICYAQGDKIEIVLKNYITNAISHCSGEKKIVIFCEKLKDTIRFSVCNSGEGIAAEDISEIWDSFYRADKAHGRSENRFGLGLSIVKSIMTTHRCAYGVENIRGGVKFTFEVPEDSSYYEEKGRKKQNKQP